MGGGRGAAPRLRTRRWAGPRPAKGASRDPGGGGAAGLKEGASGSGSGIAGRGTRRSPTRSERPPTPGRVFASAAGAPPPPPARQSGAGRVVRDAARSERADPSARPSGEPPPLPARFRPESRPSPENLLEGELEDTGRSFPPRLAEGRGKVVPRLISAEGSAARRRRSYIRRRRAWRTQFAVARSAVTVLSSPAASLVALGEWALPRPRPGAGGWGRCSGPSRSEGSGGGGRRSVRRGLRRLRGPSSCGFPS